MRTLPIVVASSVIRSTQKGESHGGLYLVDLESGSHEQVIDWDHARIDWRGRGAERGLRGIAFHGGFVYVAADEQVMVYTSGFELVETLTNPYLTHIHETFVDGATLYVCSTGNDSIIEYDLERRAFTRGYCLRQRAGFTRALGGMRRRLGVGGELPRTNSLGDRLVRFGRRVRRRLVPRGRMRDLRPYEFDASGPGGPARREHAAADGEGGLDRPPPIDTVHLNSVWVEGGSLYASGLRLQQLMQVKGGAPSAYAPIPVGTHNVRPYDGGVLYNDTRADRVVLQTLDGVKLRSCSVPHYREEELKFSELPADNARQGFARGLCVTSDGLVIGGSSPATISAYDLSAERLIRTVNLTMDVRNAIHGLEIWPF